MQLLLIFIFLVVFATWIESITNVWRERSNIEIKSDEIFLGGQSHVDTSYISLRTQSFWALTKTLISSMSCWAWYRSNRSNGTPWLRSSKSGESMEIFVNTHGASIELNMDSICYSRHIVCCHWQWHCAAGMLMCDLGLWFLYTMRLTTFTFGDFHCNNKWHNTTPRSNQCF